MGFYPEAARNPIRGYPGLPYEPGVAWRGVLHTTEVPGLYRPRPDGSYFGGKSPPHFTVDELLVWQHIDVDLGSYALENRMGGVETNRDRAIQIEVMERAVNAPNWSDPLCDRLAGLLRWLEEEKGIRRAPLDDFHFYPPENGIRLGAEPWRIPFSDWSAVDCWVGHQHCPENVHGDPGKIRLDRLFPPPVPDNPPHGVVDFQEEDVRKALVGSGVANAFGVANPRWNPGFDRPPVFVAVAPNGLVQLRSPVGAHVEGNEVVLDISMVDVTGTVLGPFDLHVVVA